MAKTINTVLHESIIEMKQPRYNLVTEAAIQEARNIINGDISAKSYSSAHELFADLDTEIDNE
ncbi:hypothetical protein [Holdemania massiliensis]|uniref:hypothetical protein n=1 Tax=Holdemania massiliensis TaxID=1468449 RepID=UPI001F069FD2|nr:hypothetical protein [Holdemania massiliensis]MCH1942228.1 hypothetical protein [Holdemania massiliensis]